jgi:3-oxoacyl-[acyl-carrier protein] reductase/meso-butanediol dehydrogenase/(S,S)-butanediol dehydrogenase/diacetyl reductase
MQGLEGKVAIVTGAARLRGIGRGIALRLAHEGCDVVVNGAPRPLESFPEDEQAAGWRGLASVVEEIEAVGRHAVAVEGDVTKREDADRLAQAALDAFGRIDILVPNAGKSYTGDRALWEIDQAEWYHVIDVNLNGVYQCLRAVIPPMLEAKRGGRIVTISSTAGRVGMAYYGAYSATKFGVVGLTQQLAQELASHGITVNCVAPGSVDTDMMDDTFGRMARRMGLQFDQVKGAVPRAIPLGRQGAPDDIAGAVAFLCSDDAAWITGQTLNVNGGNPMA